MSHDGSSDLKDSRTYENLLDAFAGDCKAAARYAFFARQARREGFVDAASALHEVARGKAEHAQGQLEFLCELGDPQTQAEVGTTRQNVASAIERTTYERETLFPDLAQTASEEGFDAVGRWFETLAAAGRNHTLALRASLQALERSFGERDGPPEGEPTSA